MDLRDLPSVDRLLADEILAGAPRSLALAAARAALDDARRTIGSGGDPGDVAALARAELERLEAPSLQRVLNATGVIVHTNLGRAPLAQAALARVEEVGGSYSNLELDLESGARGTRQSHVADALRRLTGAEAALVVNNNAAAVLLAVAALAEGREVVVSRGELVEIGGGFRIPDVMAQSGAILREVGTTNRTRGADVAAAINERTALLLRVHPSNFRIEGFTERPSLADLVTLGRKFNIPVAEDLGSGHLSANWGSDQGQTRVRSGSDPLSAEPAVEASVTAGVDICCFSGDKLLGGPQAGIIVGRRTLVDRIRKHPLMRALRVDKMTYAALEATLTEYAAGRATATVPVQRMLTMTADEVRARADAFTTALGTLTGWRAEVVPGLSAVGGGSAPGVELRTWLAAVARDGQSPDALEQRLRRLTPPVIARIEGGRVVLDLRTVLPDQDALLLSLLADL